MTKDEFDGWLKDPLTKEIFSRLREYRESINLELTNGNLVFADKGHLKIAQLVGKREGLDLILEVMYEDTQESNIDVEFEGSWPSSIDQGEEV